MNEEGIGTGFSITFGTTSYAGKVESAAIGGEEVAVIDFAHMASTGYREKKFGKLIEPPQVTVEIQYDPSAPPPLGVVETATLTWVDENDDVIGTLTGTGAIISRESTTPLEDKMTGSYVFQFDGQTGPVYDDGATT